MNKITIAINNYLSSKGLIKEQISKEEKYIEEYAENIKNLMKLDYVRLELKAYGHHSTIENYQDAIICHKKNIEKLKKGDIDFLFELMSKEEKRKQALINSQIMKLIETIEEYVECRHQPEWYKPESMSMDTFIENYNQGIKMLKLYISKLLDGDFELYHSLVQSEREN